MLSLQVLFCHWYSDLLKAQFTNVNGLKSTLLQLEPNAKPTIQNKAQIFHDRGDHWIAASNKSTVAAVDEVVVFNSVYNTIDRHTDDAIIRKFSMEGETSPKVRIMQFQNQKGSTDRGLFAIAVVTALAFVQDLSTVKFLQENMRSHLFSCFQKKITPFPIQN